MTYTTACAVEKVHGIGAECYQLRSVGQSRDLISLAAAARSQLSSVKHKFRMIP